MERALSIKQPWAWLIVNGYKLVENRDWDTKFRGEFYVHTGKNTDKDGYEWVKQTFPSIPMPPLKDMPTGGIVGKAKLIDTVHILDNKYLTEVDKPWFFGEYGFMLDDTKPCDFIPLKGQLGFFKFNHPTSDKE